MKKLSVVLITVILTACGGGGGMSEPESQPTPTPAPTPAPTPQPGPSCTEQSGSGTYYCTVTYDDIAREFYYYLPQNYSENSSAMPLLISLHGGDDYADYNMSYTGFRALADERDFIPIFPQGTVAEEKGSTGWFTGTCDSSSVCDLGFIDSVIDFMGENLNIDLNRVYATGFSNGAFMTYSLGCNLSAKIAAIAAVSGTMDIGSISTCQSIHPMPVLHIHGTNDTTIPPSGGQYHYPVSDVINFWKEFNECSYTTVYEDEDDDGDGFYFSIYSHEGCLNDVQVYDFTAGGMYHSWPRDGQTTDDMPDGSTYIVTFLERFDINGLRSSTNIDYHE